MVITKTIQVQTNSTANEYHTDIINITTQVAQQVTETNIKDGTVTLFMVGSTAGITTIEFEPGLVTDFQRMWERNIPQGISYEHNRRWGDGNGYSHVRASVLGASLVVPFKDKKLILGTWQQIVLVDFDNRPRSRQIIVQIMGE